VLDLKKAILCIFMAIPIEQITAPGKWEYDLAMEELEAELKKPAPIYKNMSQSDKESTHKHNLYYISFNIKKK
jgi:hypothetical protein